MKVFVLFVIVCLNYSYTEPVTKLFLSNVLSYTLKNNYIMYKNKFKIFKGFNTSSDKRVIQNCTKPISSKFVISKGPSKYIFKKTDDFIK